jgi:hypothetical protein
MKLERVRLCVSLIRRQLSELQLKCAAAERTMVFSLLRRVTRVFTKLDWMAMTSNMPEVSVLCHSVAKHLAPGSSPSSTHTECRDEFMRVGLRVSPSLPPSLPPSLGSRACVCLRNVYCVYVYLYPQNHSGFTHMTSVIAVVGQEQRYGSTRAQTLTSCRPIAHLARAFPVHVPHPYTGNVMPWLAGVLSKCILCRKILTHCPICSLCRLPSFFWASPAIRVTVTAKIHQITPTHIL